MRHLQRLLAAFALMLAPCAQASESADQIRALVPDSITVESIEEREGYIDVSGIAHDNAEISALMRAVNASRIGQPDLQSVERHDGASRFHVRVRLRK